MNSQQVRDLVATGRFDHLLSSLGADDYDTFTIPGIPVPFGDGEPTTFTVARIGRAHLRAIGDELKCHLHESEDEAIMCHVKNRERTERNIRLAQGLVEALRDGDMGTVMTVVAQMAQDIAEAGNGRMHVMTMDQDGNIREGLPEGVTLDDLRAAGQPAPYAPGRPVPDHVPDQWPGMYL